LIGLLEKIEDKFISLVMPDGEILSVEYLGKRSSGASKIAIDYTSRVSFFKKKKSSQGSGGFYLNHKKIA